MKIALVSSGSGSRGGGEIYLRFLVDGLAALGHEVRVLVPETPAMDDLATSLLPLAKVQRFRFRPTYTRRLRALGAWRDRQGQRELAKTFAALSVDVVHINQQVAEDGLDLVLAAAACGKPWLSTIHVGHSAAALGAQFGAGRDWVTRQALAEASGDHIAVSCSSRNQLAARFDARLHVVLNGVPMPDPHALSAARAMARAEWGVSEREIVIGTVGRIEAQKSPLSLIDHAAALAREDIRLVWIGDGTMRSALEAHAAACTKGAPLHVDGWRSDAGLRLAGLDIFVLPSVFEGLPLALLEAMHAGLPVVASRADGIAEAVTNGRTGYLCAEAADWQRALSSLLNDMALRACIGRAAQEEARTRFSTLSMAHSSLDVYHQVIGLHGMRT